MMVYRKKNPVCEHSKQVIDQKQHSHSPINNGSQRFGKQLEAFPNEADKRNGYSKSHPKHRKNSICIQVRVFFNNCLIMNIEFLLGIFLRYTRRHLKMKDPLSPAE